GRDERWGARGTGGEAPRPRRTADVPPRDGRNELPARRAAGGRAAGEAAPPGGVDRSTEAQRRPIPGGARRRARGDSAGGAGRPPARVQPVHDPDASARRAPRVPGGARHRLGDLLSAAAPPPGVLLLARGAPGRPPRGGAALRGGPLAADLPRARGGADRRRGRGRAGLPRLTRGSGAEPLRRRRRGPASDRTSRSPDMSRAHGSHPPPRDGPAPGAVARGRRQRAASRPFLAWRRRPAAGRYDPSVAPSPTFPARRAARTTRSRATIHEEAQHGERKAPVDPVVSEMSGGCPDARAGRRPRRGGGPGRRHL